MHLKAVIHFWKLQLIFDFVQFDMIKCSMDLEPSASQILYNILAFGIIFLMYVMFCTAPYCIVTYWYCSVLFVLSCYLLGLAISYHTVPIEPDDTSQWKIRHYLTHSHAHKYTCDHIYIHTPVYSFLFLPFHIPMLIRQSNGKNDVHDVLSEMS